MLGNVSEKITIPSLSFTVTVTIPVKVSGEYDITHREADKYSIFSISNWDSYQQDNQQVTNKQPASNQQVTTINNGKNEKNGNNILHQQIADKWNEMFDGELSTVSKLTPKRISAINGCIKEMKGTAHDFSKLETWAKLFQYASTIDFFMGRTKENWYMNFDFITTKSKLIRLVEGQYDN